MSGASSTSASRPQRLVSSLASVARVAGVLLLSLAACALVVLATGGSPIEAARALLAGAFGSPIRASETFSKSIPLAMAGLGVALCFRVGFWNIGAEGQFAMGALAATATATRLEGPWPLAIVVGGVAGAIWSMIASWLKEKRDAPEIISTIMLNAVAVQLVVFAVQGPLQERARTQPQSDVFPPGAQIPLLVPDTTLHSGLLVPIVSALALWWILFRLQLGFEWRASGAGERAARAGGIHASRARQRAVALGGALCGAGGALELSGATHQLSGEPFGYGFTAIAVALVASLNPLQVLPAAVFFGALDAGGKAMERSAGVPAITVAVITGAALLAVAVARRSAHSRG